MFLGGFMKRFLIILAGLSTYSLMLASEQPKKEESGDRKGNRQRGIVSAAISRLALASADKNAPTALTHAAAYAAGGPTGLVVRAETTDDKKKRRELIRRAAATPLPRPSESKKKAAQEMADEKKASMVRARKDLVRYKEAHARAVEANDNSARGQAEEIIAHRKHFTTALEGAIKYSIEKMKADDPNLSEELLRNLAFLEFRPDVEEYREETKEEFDLRELINSLNISSSDLEKSRSPREKDAK